jgi:hypothetical protein
MPKFGVFGKALSLVFLIGYGAIPVLILVRIVGN